VPWKNVVSRFNWLGRWVLRIEQWKVGFSLRVVFRGARIFCGSCVDSVFIVLERGYYCRFSDLGWRGSMGLSDLCVMGGSCLSVGIARWWSVLCLMEEVKLLKMKSLVWRWKRRMSHREAKGRRESLLKWPSRIYYCKFRTALKAHTL
jgi:hypothetical protein